MAGFTPIERGRHALKSGMDIKAYARSVRKRKATYPPISVRRGAGERHSGGSSVACAEEILVLETRLGASDAALITLDVQRFAPAEQPPSIPRVPPDERPSPGRRRLSLRRDTCAR
jgi:hypothetical protein